MDEADVPSMLRNLTWLCHSCGDERPDAAIDVMTRAFEVIPGVSGRVNLRYCNDRLVCAFRVADRVGELIAFLQRGRDRHTMENQG